MHSGPSFDALHFDVRVSEADRVKRSLPTLGVLIAMAGCTPTGGLAPQEGSGGQPPTWIFGGSSATAARHEAVVALHELEGGQIYVDPFCTGTLIRAEWVLTAAHCIGGFDRDPATLAIYVGKDPSRDLEDHTHGVSEIHVFPQFDEHEITGDLALLRLPDDVAGLEGVAPVPDLDNLHGLTNADAGTLVDLVGFGLTQTGSAGSKLHVLEKLGGLVVDPVAKQIWTDQSDGTGTCHGDSGGSLMIKRAEGWRVAGITSYGDADCTDYGVYTQVDPYEQWITDVIAGVDSGPPASGPPADTTPPGIELRDVYVDGQDSLLTFTTDESAVCRTCDEHGVCTTTGWATAHEAGYAPFAPPVTLVCVDRAHNEGTVRADW